MRYGDIPVLLVLQNPQLDDAYAEVRSAGAQWAAEAGVGVIDVAGAFPEGGGDLLLDAVQPNGAGQELWARVVADALG